MSNPTHEPAEGQSAEQSAAKKKKNPLSAPDYPPAPTGDQVMALRRDGATLHQKRSE